MMQPDEMTLIAQERQRDWEREMAARQLREQLPSAPSRWRQWMGQTMLWMGATLTRRGTVLTRDAAPGLAAARHANA